MYPQTPDLGRLRPATIRDVPRIAVVATAGMYYSRNFAWERPYHASYPGDTLKSFEKRFADFIRDPEYITLVIEDSYKADENERTDAVIMADAKDLQYSPGDQVIVGVVTWKLEPGSVRRGQFLDSEDAEDSEATIYDGGLRRDLNLSHCALLYEKYGLTAAKYFKGCTGVFIVVVHPAYWCCGHGATMVRWGLELAELDGVDQGIFGSIMGKKLYLSLDFKEVGNIRLQDEENPLEVVELSVLKYESNRSPERMKDEQRGLEL